MKKYFLGLLSLSCLSLNAAALPDNSFYAGLATGLSFNKSYDATGNLGTNNAVTLDVPMLNTQTRISAPLFLDFGYLIHQYVSVGFTYNYITIDHHAPTEPVNLAGAQTSLSPDMLMHLSNYFLTAHAHIPFYPSQPLKLIIGGGIGLSSLTTSNISNDEPTGTTVANKPVTNNYAFSYFIDTLLSYSNLSHFEPYTGFRYVNYGHHAVATNVMAGNNRSRPLTNTPKVTPYSLQWIIGCNYYFQ